MPGRVAQHGKCEWVSPRGPDWGLPCCRCAQPGIPIPVLTLRENRREASCIKWELLMWGHLCTLFKEVSSHLKNSASLFRLLCRVYMRATASTYLGGVCSAKNWEKDNVKERTGKKSFFKIFHQNYFDLDCVLAVLLQNTAELTPSKHGGK